jgi:hypothetical protein
MFETSAEESHDFTSAMSEESEFIGPGKLFETEEEAVDEYISYLEWATQTPPEEVEKFWASVRGYLEQIEYADNPGPRGFISWKSGSRPKPGY